MIPLWRRYQKSVMCSIFCAGLAALLVGNISFRHGENAVDSPVPAVLNETETPQSENKPAVIYPRVIKYTVIQGDNLQSIAQKYGIDAETIWGANPELTSDVIYPGQQLDILSEKGVLHVVKQDQTFWSIARVYGVDWQKILSDNPGIDPDVLQPGQKIFVRGAKPRSEGEVSRGSINLPFRWPVKGSITSSFGYRWGALHTGVDIAADSGEPVYAARGGRVTHAGWMGGYGLAVVIDHGRGWETLYGHASALYVASGDAVEAGQCIAAAGSTGNSTGPHLHFEIRIQSIPHNPMQYLP